MSRLKYKEKKKTLIYTMVKANQKKCWTQQVIEAPKKAMETLSKKKKSSTAPAIIQIYLLRTSFQY